LTEIRAVYDSWIDRPLRYLETRFPARLFAPCAALLAVAGLAGGRTPRLADMVLAFLLALTLLLQFRLLDDLSDLPQDRERHPERILTQAGSLVPFLVLLGICMLINSALVAVQPGPRHRLVLFLIVNAAAFLWYFVLRDVLNGKIFRYHVVIAKYPIFVLLLSGDTGTTWQLFLSMAAVYLCFSIYEVLHDQDLQLTRRARTSLVVEIGTLFAVSALMTFEVMGTRPAFALLQGILGLSSFLILSDLFLRRRMHLASARSGYVVFVLCFVLVLNFSIGVRS
jgi:hypothetical protein